ncbi:DNA polymerase III subunit delta' [Sphingomonas mesophila]|uniref:DNA polymerase III subunit delta' n=1 Tax=Sphingomonas mesophila TaxID=2303576 RepID=UPI001F081A09|nr:DNA polymerase III subunit delta' [Sphingomonas mesophila]
MSAILGHDPAIASFLAAWRGGAMHHAWLIAGQRGIGKASFARAAAKRILAEAAGHVSADAPLDIDPATPTARFIDSDGGSAHPDFVQVERGLNKSGTAPARNITVDQIRDLAGLFERTPALSPWRAVVIDSVDDLEKGAANALLKMLEEPPANCLFLLVSHVPGRLLPTIRSRCRTLAFAALDDDAMTSVLARALPDLDESRRRALVESAGGSAGRALALAALDLDPLRADALALMRQGDPSNARRARLMQALTGRNSAERYAAFLDLAPALIATEARHLDGDARLRALDAYGEARELGRLAPRLSLDPATTAFRLGAILASVAEGGPAR